jgi:membrane peptidoglycan carboxypeptidase
VRVAAVAGGLLGLYGALLWIASRRATRIEHKTVPGVKKLLVRLHRDLFAIERKIISCEGAPVLTSFEKLVLVLEDRRFLRHSGFDPIAFTRELLKAVVGRRHGGASTIDMQFVRTATGFKDKNLRRKLYEIALASMIQYRYSKLLILRSYLDCAFFGSHLYGADRASLKVNGKALAELSDNEASKLAAMLVYPRPLRPEEEWGMKIERRAAYGLRRMARFEKSFEKIPTRK